MMGYKEPCTLSYVSVDDAVQAILQKGREAPASESGREERI